MNMWRNLSAVFAVIFGGAAHAWASPEVLEGFSGVFIRVFLGYAAIIAVSHFFFLFLPRLRETPVPAVENEEVEED